MARRLYVETVIRADLDELWRRTQDPHLHQRWDLRFTRIDYLPKTGAEQRFRYTVRVLPGLVVGGTGITVGERTRPDGSRTSALRFGSAHPLSLIRHGSGYWRYEPTSAGIRFVTGYDYQPGWGRLGPLADLPFRRLLGWGTAWSFDRLRLWLEHGVPPETSLRRALMDTAWRVALCTAAWRVALRGTGWQTTLRASGLLGMLSGTSSRTKPCGAGSRDTLRGGTWWIAPVLLAAAITLGTLLLPPSPSTPAARRCRRQPPSRAEASVAIRQAARRHRRQPPGRNAGQCHVDQTLEQL